MFHFDRNSMAISGRLDSHSVPFGAAVVQFGGVPLRFSGAEISVSLDQLRWSLIELLGCFDANKISVEADAIDELVDEFDRFDPVSSDESLDGATYKAAGQADNLLILASRWESWGEVTANSARLQVLSCKIHDAREVVGEFSKFIDAALQK